MPKDWNDEIIISELGDEPELSEEFASLFERLQDPPPNGQAAAPIKAPHVILNFAGVTYLNSSHLAALLRLRKRAMELGRSLVLCSMGDDVWSVMMLTGLDKVFRFAQDTAMALAWLQLEDGDGPRR